MNRATWQRGWRGLSVLAITTDPDRRKGITARWPAVILPAWYGGIPCGVWLRFGDRALLITYIPRPKQRRHR